MATAAAPSRFRTRVQLGYPDEEISDRFSNAVDFATSKIGGVPVFPSSAKTSHPAGPDLCCTLCSASTALVCQIYAPLDDSPYHRTLYVFACLTPKCWNKSESWKCFRLQLLDMSTKTTNTTTSKAAVATAVTKTTDWLDDADDWGDDETTFHPQPVTAEEENGNFVPMANGPTNLNQNLALERLSLNDLSPTAEAMSPSPTSEVSEPSSSCSSTVSPELGAGGARVGNANANAAASVGDAIGDTLATAEIEDDQDDVIAVETPPPPEEMSNATIPFLFAEPADNDGGSLRRRKITHFRPLFVTVAEERFSDVGCVGAALTEHERQLLLDYKDKEAHEAKKCTVEGKSSGGGEVDAYEKVLPKHGDALFHKFVSVIQENPGQVLRYTRDIGHTPLFLSKPSSSQHKSVSAVPDRCSYCKGRLHCELQILPTLITALRPEGGGDGDAEDVLPALEFGTALIYTCTKSCWREGDSFKLEKMLVQAEN